MTPDIKFYATIAVGFQGIAVLTLKETALNGFHWNDGRATCQIVRDDIISGAGDLLDWLNWIVGHENVPTETGFYQITGYAVVADDFTDYPTVTIDKLPDPFAPINKHKQNHHDQS